MKKYLYSRADFPPPCVRLMHMDLYLDFRGGKVEGTGILRLQALQRLDRIALDARDIEIRRVEWLDAAGPAPEVLHDVSAGTRGMRGRPLVHDFQAANHKLIVTLPRAVNPGETFAILTAATCVPSDTILEGIYKDTTPPGCPQQYISQCQQWGFQRILPVFDDCTAKCTMVTTLEADARYTHLISNGNISRSRNPAGRPVPKPGDPSRQVITYENAIPMAPYLFIVAVGTWDVLEDEVVYPSGRRVRLEYLAPPGRKAGASAPMRILKEAVLWHGRTQEYDYPREVYRTICMEKSNFGGMENVGNTTIVTDAALIDEYTNDSRLEYAHGVIVHEFEHNQCGSDVTMDTPFDMWLNEAFTVDVERQFLHSQFDPACMRLDEVDRMRAPVSGPLAVEDGGHLGKIVRDGFNDPDELVDGVTYVKAAEVIRMLRLILGAETFRQAKNLYFRRYDGRNANTDQFFGCFEEVSRRDLSQFRREWLHTIGYPRIEAEHAYDAATRTLRVRFRQSRVGRGGLFHLPLNMAAVGADGRDIPGTAQTVEITGESRELAFAEIPEPAFMSFSRDGSFYGTFADRSSTPAMLIRQIMHDPSLYNRIEAMRRVTDLERIRLIRDPFAAPGSGWLDLFGAVLADRSLPPGLKAYLLRIDEPSLDREYLPMYRERYRARITLLRAAARRHLAGLVRLYDSIDTYRPPREPKDGIDERRLKGVLLRILTEAHTPDTQALAEAHFRRAWNITDRLNALACINLSEHPGRHDLLAEGYACWQDHLSAYAGYLAIVGGGRREDVFDLIAAEEQRPTFRIQHPTLSRALFLPMAGNNKMLWTDRGIEWMTETVVRLAGINENTAIRLLAAFQQVSRLAEDLKPKVAAALEAMSQRVDAASAPSVAGRIRAYLDGVEADAERCASMGKLR